MGEKRCEVCKFWTADLHPPGFGGCDFGLCSRIGSAAEYTPDRGGRRELAITSDSGGMIAPFHTKPGFGCVLWEGTPAASP